MQNQIKKDIHENMPRYIDMLSSLVAIPSISFDNFDQKYVLDSANAVKAMFEKAGLTNIQFLMPPSGRPSVYAESLTSPDKPTILLYAHHDVQPPMREALWDTPPFKATQKGDRLFGRGTADDKAGIIVHLAALEQVRRDGTCRTLEERRRHYCRPRKLREGNALHHDDTPRHERHQRHASRDKGPAPFRFLVRPDSRPGTGALPHDCKPHRQGRQDPHPALRR